MPSARRVNDACSRDTSAVFTRNSQRRVRPNMYVWSCCSSLNVVGPSVMPATAVRYGTGAVDGDGEWMSLFWRRTKVCVGSVRAAGAGAAAGTMPGAGIGAAVGAGAAGWATSDGAVGARAAVGVGAEGGF